MNTFTREYTITFIITDEVTALDHQSAEAMAIPTISVESLNVEEAKISIPVAIKVED
jgi:hypothetical protein